MNIANKEIKRLFIGWTSTTPLGMIWVAVSVQGLVATEMGGTEGSFTQRLVARFGVPLTPSEFQVGPFIQEIESYFQGTSQTFEIPIHWELLSPFQQKALRAVCAIPYGETCTYGQIAVKLGLPHAARAVGRANATNPMPLVIPCHRLVGSDGSLRGYGSGEGLKTKVWLLDFEKANSAFTTKTPRPKDS
ncbi:MAG TPA: cysteine methyltransferase [Chloroflexi bacterium]|nr:cysteine methyltransferase [Chloroflexota bacterium]